MDETVSRIALLAVALRSFIEGGADLNRCFGYMPCANARQAAGAGAESIISLLACRSTCYNPLTHMLEAAHSACASTPPRWPFGG